MLPLIEGDPGAGDSGGVRSLAQVFTTRAAELTTRAAEAAAAATELAGTTSAATTALTARVALARQRFEEAATGSTEVARIMGGYATSLDQMKSLARRRLQAAADAYDDIWARRREALNAGSEFIAGWALGWDDVIASWMYMSDPAYLRCWQTAIEVYRGAAGSYNALQGERDALDRAAAAELSRIDLIKVVARNGAIGSAALPAGVRVWAGNLSGLTAASLASLGNAGVVREVWNSLTATQRSAMITTAPLVIGNLNGIPLRERITANQINIGNEIRRRENEIAALKARRDEMLASMGGVRANAWRIADIGREIEDHQRYIDSYNGLLTKKWTWLDANRNPVSQVGVNIVAFDPAADSIASYSGAIDPVTGDIPDWVRHVAVSVPGTGANMASFSEDRAGQLYAAAGSQSAVFQWAGGAFPQSIPDAMRSSFSHDLAPALAGFVNSVDTPSAATMTVLGHSYGGATVGLAEQAGMKADRVLYVSAAGMGDGVSGVKDFPYTSKVPHYSMMARGDIVVGLIQGNKGDLQALHGQSALMAEGVTRLETGFLDASNPGGKDIESTGGIESHSSVYTPGSTAFNNMVGVITGGSVETFAEDEIVPNYAGGQPTVIDGIDRSDYAPHYIEVK